MARVFTIFFCGTGSNSEDYRNVNYHSGELISTLARNHLGEEYVDWIIVDGPGSGNLRKNLKWVSPSDYSTSIGQALGSGVHNNVAHAIQVLKGEYLWEYDPVQEEMESLVDPIEILLYGISSMFEEREPSTQKQQLDKRKRIETERYGGSNRQGARITHVNLIGWSRGAVTCHMMANAMYEDSALNNIQVRLFAIDPVGGPLKSLSRHLRLRENVREYVGVYARNERSWGFTPILATLHSTTKVTYLPLPGRHATLVGNAKLNGLNKGQDILIGPGRVVRWFAEQKLTEWGTLLSNKLPNNICEILKYYDLMLKNEPHYQKMEKMAYTLSYSGRRQFVEYIDSNSLKMILHMGSGYTTGDRFSFRKTDPIFVNWQHKKLFMDFIGTTIYIANLTRNRTLLGRAFLSCLFLFPITMGKILALCLRR